jgi:tryptophan 2,3-dioxygenase
MQYRFLFLFFLPALQCFAQDKPVEGIVFDKTTKARIASINVHDLNNHVTVYNNLKGEFKIKADVGDRLVFTRQDYHPDTIKVINKDALAIYMTHVAIQLKEVTVHDSALTPDQQLARTKEEYAKIYSPSLNPDWFNNSEYGGAGISIDAIWDAVSREGRNAANLRELIERDYEQHVIDYRFNRTFVERVTGLKDGRLTSFMLRYRPGYFTVRTMTDYEFITMIRANLRRFLHYRRVYAMPPLTRS